MLKEQAYNQNGTGSNNIFPGFLRPTTTPVPDEVFDLLMHQLSGAEFKVLLYICRRTFGFKKDVDNISISQLVNGITTKDGKVLDRGTGLSKDSVSRVVRTLEEKGVIIRTRRRSAEKGDEATTYSLNFLNVGAEFPLPPVSENRVRGSVKIGDGGVRLSGTQQTVLQETEEQHVIVVLAQLQKFGLSDKVSADFTEKYPAAYLTGKLQQAQALVDQDSPLVGRNPAGWLRKAIEENFQPAESSSTRKQKKVAAAVGVEKEIADTIRERYREQSTPEPIGDAGLTAETAWAETLDQLKEKLPGSAYQRLEATALLSVADNSAVVMVPDASAAEYLNRRLYQSIARGLGDVVGQEVELQFITV